jgi:hypothetical protein
MKLYCSPGACSLSPHIVLRESGLPFTPVMASTKTHQLPDGTDYYTINPLGYVPLLKLGSGATRPCAPTARPAARPEPAKRDRRRCMAAATSRPCRTREAAAGWPRIERMVHGDALTDAGLPSWRDASSAQRR